MDAFGVKAQGQELTTVEYLDQSAYDEKFEIILKEDFIRNIYHVENKYMVPVLQGGYREMYEYCNKYLIYPGDHIYAELMNPDTLEERLRASETPGMVKAEFREKLVDGSFRWVQYLGVAGEEHGVPEGHVYFYVYDVQVQKDRMEGKASLMYTRDKREAVTGLHAGEAFIPSADELLQKAPGSWCCMAIDIQHFRIFSAWFGYEKGNYLLCRIGEYLRGIEEREDAVAACFGRDQFALFMHYDAEAIKKIYADIRELIYSFSKMIGFLPAIGVVILDGEKRIALDVYDRARLAAEEAKKSYTDRICYFDSAAYKKERADYEFLSTLQSAFAEGTIGFYLQPVCRTFDKKVVGAEALVRWIRHDGRIVEPAGFVPFLENIGFITELDKRVWEGVCQWINSLLERNIKPVPVSVNVSQVDLLSLDVAAYLYALTERYHIPVELIRVEITESAYVSNYDIITRSVDELKRRGFVVYLDDFGAGYSSLNMLDKVNVDVLKLDMAFMKKESSLSRKGIGIVESILSMTKALEIPVIIEGVETDEQISFLGSLGCQYAQGYRFFRPMAVPSFEELLQNDDKISYEGIFNRATDLFHAKEFLTENLFTDGILNQVLGPVAYYTLDGKDLTIDRFNEPFYQAIGDASMNTRKTAIQNYVVKDDRPMLYQALKDAEENLGNGGNCEVRFYKSDNSVFWFRMQFFFLKEEGSRKLFYGQIEDITESREQSIQFFEVLREQADVTMRMDLDRNRIQYIVGENTLSQVELPSMHLDESIRLTAESRIESPEDRKAFIEFFDLKRLKDAYKRAIYHEILNIDFKLTSVTEPVEFSTYYIRQSKNENLTVYAFAKKRDRELLEKDPLTGMRNRYSYNEILRLYENRDLIEKDLVILSMDVNGLKATNDTFGHLIGDKMLRGAAECMNSVLSPYGSCYRIGGDEFVAFLYGNREIAESLKQDLDRVMNAWSGDPLTGLSVSVGIVVAAECPDLSVPEMVKLADREMYRAKSLFYQQMGKDRRMQQAAYNALCSSYAKILKVDLGKDRFEIIRADERELRPEKGYSEKISFWLQEFARTEQVHEEDKARYLEKTDIDYLRRYFRGGKTHFSIHYRRKIGENFKEVMMEIIPAPEYKDDNQKVFLYVKDVGK